MQQTTHNVDGCTIKINPSEESVSITIQENKNGRFGKSKTLSFTPEELQMTLEGYQGDEAQFFKDLVIEAKQERAEEKKEKPQLKNPFKNLKISFPKIKSYASRTLIVLVIVSVGIIVASYESKSMKITRLGEQILQLEAEISSVRSQREMEYDACLDQCMQDRSPYDQQVNGLIDEANEIKERIQEINR